VRSKTEEMWQ